MHHHGSQCSFFIFTALAIADSLSRLHSANLHYAGPFVLSLSSKKSYLKVDRWIIAFDQGYRSFLNHHNADFTLKQKLLN